MQFRLALEDIEPNHWVAYALDMPGCFSSAKSKEEAIGQAPKRISQYLEWVKQHGVISIEIDLPIEVELVEQFHSFESVETKGYIVNAFFEDDKDQLGYWDVEAALRLMGWSRNDLLSLIGEIKYGQLGEDTESEKFESVTGILKHIAIAENWYFDRMELGLERELLPEDVFEMLAVVRKNARRQLVKLVGNKRIVHKNGEYWSSRKVIRRTLWHERDHTHHIEQILEQAQNGFGGLNPA